MILIRRIESIQNVLCFVRPKHRAYPSLSPLSFMVSFRWTRTFIALAWNHNNSNEIHERAAYFTRTIQFFFQWLLMTFRPHSHLKMIPTCEVTWIFPHSHFTHGLIQIPITSSSLPRERWAGSRRTVRESFDPTNDSSSCSSSYGRTSIWYLLMSPMKFPNFSGNFTRTTIQ